MIKAQIRIAGGAPADITDKYGFIYVGSDDVFGVPLRELETTSYAEESGEHADPRTTAKAFDFKAKFLVYKETAPLRNLALNSMPKGEAGDTDTPPAHWARYSIKPLMHYNADGTFGITSDRDLEAEGSGNWYSGIYDGLSEFIVPGRTYTMRVMANVSGLTKGKVRFGWLKAWTNTREFDVTKDCRLDRTYTFVAPDDAAEADAHGLFCSFEATNAGATVDLLGWAIYEGDIKYAPYYKAPEDTPDLNEAIAMWNSDVSETVEGVVKRREVELTIPYKKLKITGLGQPVGQEDVTDFRRVRGYEASEVELTIRVTDPGKCDFNLSTKTLSQESLTTMTASD